MVYSTCEDGRRCVGVLVFGCGVGGVREGRLMLEPPGLVDWTLFCRRRTWKPRPRVLIADKMEG